MDDYRSDAGKVAVETRWTFFRFLPVFLLVVVVLFFVGFALKSAGIIGKTIVEREVFEQSYQRSEALRSRIATDEAVVSEISSKLLNPNLDEDTRFNLEAQLSAARVRISTAERMQ